MSDLTQFTFEGSDVRSVTIDGEPWFIASDIARVLGYHSAKDMTRSIDADDKGGHETPTPGGTQEVTVISEAGLYQAILQRQTGRMNNPEMKNFVQRFKRWVTSEVLPSIRKTGSYGAPAPLTGPELMAAALIEAQSTLAAKDQEIRALAPKAEAFDGYIGAGGDYSFNEAAKLLQRRGVDTGQYKLVKTLLEWKWIYRGKRRAPRAMQAQIDTGRLAEKTYYFIDDRTGEERAGRTQTRVTPKGVEDIYQRLTANQLVEVGA